MGSRFLYTIIFSFLTLINLSLVFVIQQDGKNKIKSEIQKNLKNQTVLLKLFIDEKQHLYEEILEQKLSENSFQYKTLFKIINDKLKKTEEIRFIYTIYKEKEKILFGLDGSDYGDLDKDGVEDHVLIHSEYKEVSSEILVNYSKEKDFFTSIYVDRWGSHISYFLPIVSSSGNFLGYLGTDMDARNYFSELSSLNRRLLFLLAIIELLLLVSTLFLYFYLKKEETLFRKNKEIEMMNLSKLALLGEFSSFITHEINNPLQIISGNNEIMNEIMNEFIEQDENIRGSKLLPFVKTNIQTMIKITEIIKNVKNLTKNQELSLTPTELDKVVIETENLFIPLLNKKGISYKKEFLTNSKVMADYQYIQQILLNLINNSIYAIKNNEEKWIDIKILEDKDFVYLKVIDSGLGLSKEIQEKIKEKFFTSKPNGEGSGLGLSICKKIIEAHNGDFYYNPNEENTCFEFKLKKIS